MSGLKQALAAALAMFAQPACGGDWAAKSEIRYYAVAGATPIDLYRSIGENGPAAGAGRAIAHTLWDLKWRRYYQRQGTSCVLSSATPFLTITTTLPKPRPKLSSPVAARWQAFIAGIRAHEDVHGKDIIAMVDDIIAATVGLRVDNDPGCTAIRAQVLKRVEAANEAYKAKSRAFDQMEMRSGGAVHKLILAFVNG